MNFLKRLIPIARIGVSAVAQTNPISAVLSGVIEIVEAFTAGKATGQAKSQMAIDMSHIAFQHLAKNGVLPAVPPKEELQQINDGIVKVKNAKGWDIAPAVADTVNEIDDVVQLMLAAFRAGQAAAPPPAEKS